MAMRISREVVSELHPYDSQASPSDYWAAFDAEVKDGTFHGVTEHFEIAASHQWALEAGCAKSCLSLLLGPTAARRNLGL